MFSNKHSNSGSRILVSSTITFVVIFTIALATTLVFNAFLTIVGATTSKVAAATYTTSVSTSGTINLDVSSAGNGASVTTDNVEVISTCPSGYNLSVAGPADTTLYKDGAKTGSTDSTKINASVGTKDDPLPILGSAGGTSYVKTWGFMTEELNNDSPVTINSNFIGLTNTETVLRTKTSASGDGSTTNKDTIPVYYGVSVDNSIAPGVYSMAESTAGANDNVITYYLTTSIDCISYTVEFNPTSTAGGKTLTGTGTMNPQRIFEGVNTNLSPNGFTGPTVDGITYYFAGWNTSQNGTGTSYTDGQSVIDLTTPGSNITLYAQWDLARLDTGRNVNQKMKRVAGNAGASYETADTKIQSILKANSLPSGFTPTVNNTISLSTSRIPVYIFFDNTSGTLYYYSTANEVFMNSSSSDMFNNFRSLANIGGLSSWNASSVTSMYRTFRFASSLANISALSSWDTSSVRDMREMFYGVISLTNINGASSWNTSAVTNMSSMFFNTYSLVNIDGAKDWNTSAVTDMSLMFGGATSLANINGASSWNTSAVTNMSQMFTGATSLANINGASSWNTSSVTNMYRMFRSTPLTDINSISSWNTSSVTNMNGMFEGATSLANINGASSWNTSAVTDMSAMFYQATSLANIDGARNWNTSSVTNMYALFYGNSSLANIDSLSSWVTSSVTNMSSMFSYASSLANINGASSWDTSAVTNMNHMFSNDPSLTDINGASSWVTSSVTNISNMFANTDRINATVLNGWDVSSVTNKTNAFTCPIPYRPSWY